MIKKKNEGRGTPGTLVDDRLTLSFFQAEDGIRDLYVTGVQTCALPIWRGFSRYRRDPGHLVPVAISTRGKTAGRRAGVDARFPEVTANANFSDQIAKR